MYPIRWHTCVFRTTLKSNRSFLFTAVTQIKKKKKFIVNGTPLFETRFCVNNNWIDSNGYFSLFNWIRFGYAATKYAAVAGGGGMYYLKCRQIKNEWFFSFSFCSTTNFTEAKYILMIKIVIRFFSSRFALNWFSILILFLCADFALSWKLRLGLSPFYPPRGYVIEDQFILFRYIKKLTLPTLSFIVKYLIIQLI